MNEYDFIKTSLRHADKSLAGQSRSDAGQIAGAVKVRIRKIRRFRRNAAVISITIAAVLTGWGQNILHERKAAEQTARMRAQSEALIAQSNMLASMAAQLNAELENKRQIDRLRGELAQIHETMDNYRQRQDAIVYKMLYEANGLAKDAASVKEAIEVYDNLIKYFPESRYADTAKRRLEKLKDENKPQEKI